MSKEITELYEGMEIVFRKSDSNVFEVRIDEVAKFCGWTQVERSGNECVKWSRVNKHLQDLAHPQVYAGDFIPEYLMYPLIGKASNQKATDFSIWVGKVLVQLRTKGVVIMEHAEIEVIEFEKHFGSYRIRKTFQEADNIVKMYEKFSELSAEEWKKDRINNDDRINLSAIIIDTLEKRLEADIREMKGSEILSIREVISDIKTDMLRLANKKHGGIKAGLTKQVNQLKEKLEELTND
jgi:prophage antirepressor-like protein